MEVLQILLLAGGYYLIWLLPFVVLAVAFAGIGERLENRRYNKRCGGPYNF